MGWPVSSVWAATRGGHRVLDLSALASALRADTANAGITSPTAAACKYDGVHCNKVHSIWLLTRAKAAASDSKFVTKAGFGTAAVAGLLGYMSRWRGALRADRTKGDTWKCNSHSDASAEQTSKSKVGTVNVQSIFQHAAKLWHIHQVDIAILQETWHVLTAKAPRFDGYTCMCESHREGIKGGGTVILARSTL
eukprot:2156213-Amphidinium_carterae.1